MNSAVQLRDKSPSAHLDREYGCLLWHAECREQLLCSIADMFLTGVTF